MHAVMIVGLLILAFFSPPFRYKTPPTIKIGFVGPGNNPNLPPGSPGPLVASVNPAQPDSPAPAPSPAPTPQAKKEAPAPTPAPKATPAATPRPQVTPPPKPVQTPIIKPTQAPTPKPQTTPKPATPPTVKAPVENKKPAVAPRKVFKKKSEQKLVEISHTPVPTPTPKATPEPKTEEISGTVGDSAPAIPSETRVAEASPVAPPLPLPPAPVAPLITGPGGTGSAQKVSTGGSISGGITTAGGTGNGGGGGGGGTLLSSLSQTYLAILINRVEENFKPPFSRPGVLCQIQFVIEKSGAISNIQIVKPTGVESLDHLAVQALEMTRLPALYDGMDVTSLPVIITFDFNKKSF